MRRYELKEVEWNAIQDQLPCQPGYKGKVVDNRLFINAVLYVAKCGIPWRDLPERLGKWNTVYVRFRRWAKAGVWQSVLDAFTNKELKLLLIDSTTVRVHQHAAGALKKHRRGQQKPSGNWKVKRWMDD